jgi:speckle-type POZ protein
MESHGSRGYPKFSARTVLFDPASKLLVNDCLTIKLSIIVQGTQAPAAAVCVSGGDRFHYAESSGTVGSHLAKYFVLNSNNLHDFAIIVPNTESADADGNEPKTQEEVRVPTHKLILAARSPVFRAMLSSGMHEASADEMEITGFPAKAVKAFVRFLYLDSCAKTILEQHAWDLFALADKYDVQPLRALCEAYLAQSIQDTTVISTLQRADLHDVPSLKRKSLEYIAQHSKTVAKKPRLLEELSVELLCEVVRTLAGAEVQEGDGAEAK